MGSSLRNTILQWLKEIATLYDMAFVKDEIYETWYKNSPFGTSDVSHCFTRLYF